MNNSISKSWLEEQRKLFVYLTCFYILTWYLQLNSRVEFFGSIRFEFLLGAFLSISALVTLTSSQMKRSPLINSTFFFLTILFCYTIFSYDVKYSWDIFLNRGLKFAMLALFFTAFIRTPWALKMAVGAFLLAMLKLGQEGFIGWYTGSQMWQNQGVLRLHGSVSMYGHPNSFSGMAVGCLPFIYYLFPSAGKFWKYLLLILFVFCMVIIVFTGSRTGYVATLGLGFIIFIKSQRKERWRYLILAVLTVVAFVIFAPADYLHRFQSIFTMQEKEGASAETRIEILKDAVGVYLANPLGVGVGAFPLVREAMYGRTQDTHNLYLELLTNLGPLGLIAFFVLIFRILRENYKMQKQMEALTLDNKQFIIASSKAIVAFIYARLFLGLFGMDTYEIYWWFAVGVTFSLNSIVQDSQNKSIYH